MKPIKFYWDWKDLARLIIKGKIHQFITFFSVKAYLFQNIKTITFAFNVSYLTWLRLRIVTEMRLHRRNFIVCIVTTYYYNYRTRHSRTVSWMRRNEYLSNEGIRAAQNPDKPETK